MTPDNGSLASPDHDRDDDDTQILDRVVAEYVDRLNSGERIDHLEIMANHPDEGEQILRERVEREPRFDAQTESTSPDQARRTAL